ncbi:MAG: methionyl-tRNA formyltransferase [Sphaerochaetaceae bacterium]
MEGSNFRILFAATPAIGIPTLRALVDNFEVVGVLSNPDKPTGRGRSIEAPPIKEEALKLNLKVIQAEKLTKDVREEVASLKPNLLISFACGHYFGPRFLALFPSGALNIHPSLLPKYRGSSPIQFALLEGAKQTGVTIQRIAKEIDSGNILASQVIELDGTETTASLSEKIANLVPSLLIETLKKLSKGEIEETVQCSDEATFSRLLTKEDGVIEWDEEGAKIECKIRAFTPWPRASTTFNGIPLAIIETAGFKQDPSYADIAVGTVNRFVKGKGLEVVCKDGVIYLSRLHLAQKKEMDSAAFINGNPQIIGSILGK